MTARAAYRVIFGAGLAAFFLSVAWGLAFSVFREGRLPEVREHVDSLEDHRAIASIERRSPDALANLGEALRRRGDLEGAARAYERALWLDPRALDRRIALVRLRVAQGRLDEARRDARRALEQGAVLDEDLRRALGLAPPDA